MDMGKLRNVVVLLVLALLFVGGEVSARFVSEEEARIVARNWLEMTPTESFALEGIEVREVMHFAGGFHGNPGYYVVLLNPSGWVIVPADDRFEAIIAFGEGSFSREEYARSPLAAFLSVNITDEIEESLDNQRQTSRRRGTAPSFRRGSVQNEARTGRAGRWRTLSTPHTTSDSYIMPMSDNNRSRDRIPSTDVIMIVQPILMDNTWNHGYLDVSKDIPYFNLHTYWGRTRYLAGCVAIATAQMMSVFKHPSGPPRANSSDETRVPFASTITMYRNFLGFEANQDFEIPGYPVIRDMSFLVKSGDIIVGDVILGDTSMLPEGTIVPQYHLPRGIPITVGTRIGTRIGNTTTGNL